MNRFGIFSVSIWYAEGLDPLYRVYRGGGISKVWPREYGEVLPRFDLDKFPCRGVAAQDGDRRAGYAIVLSEETAQLVVGFALIGRRGYFYF